ncbi:MAG: hypothetical protein WD071_00055 [Pseudohongiella sp.]|uniref:hypothetical protein n=1 Tax=Pseudohongiella sp. TaxID=1979412 RepID=UPI0034A01C70
MLGKVLITLLVIIVAAIFLRKQRARQRVSDQPSRPSSQRADPWQGQNRKNPTDLPADALPTMAGNMKTVLWFVLAGIVIAGSLVTYLQWQDQQRLVTVLLYRDADQSPVIYRVSKRNIGDSSFITEDGTQVTVSANERMEIVGL